MSHKHHGSEEETENSRLRGHNTVKVCNSGNSTNNLSVNSDSNAKVFSSAEAEVEQDEEGEDTF